MKKKAFYFYFSLRMAPADVFFCCRRRWRYKNTCSHCRNPILKVSMWLLNKKRQRTKINESIRPPPPNPPSYPKKKELNRKKRSSVPLLKIWLVNCLLPNIFGAHNQISLAKKRIKIEKVRNSIKKCYFCLYSYLNKAKKTLLERTSFFHLVFTEPHL